MTREVLFLLSSQNGVELPISLRFQVWRIGETNSTGRNPTIPLHHTTHYKKDPKKELAIGITRAESVGPKRAKRRTNDQA